MREGPDPSSHVEGRDMTVETNHGAAVLVITGPGLPLSRFRSAPERFEAQLEERFGSPVLVHGHATLVDTRPDGSLRFGAAAAFREQFDSIDGVLVLTVMPAAQMAFVRLCGASRRSASTSPDRARRRLRPPSGCELPWQ